MCCCDFIYHPFIFRVSPSALPTKPVCNQVFNLFLPFDPCASRLEPLIDPMFSNVEPAHLPRYQVFPFSAEILFETHPMETKSQQDGEISQSPETPTETMFGTKNRDGCKLSLTGSCNSVDTFYESQSRFLNSGIYAFGILFLLCIHILSHNGRLRALI